MNHVPVLVDEVLSILSPKGGDRVIDATFGGGGHTMELLERCDCRVLGVDRDPDTTSRALQVKSQYPDRFDFVLGKFSGLYTLLEEHGKFDGILFDFGVSSFQLDNPGRGFAFSKDGVLDMRMSKDGISAFDVINTFSESDLADIIWTYGDEPRARKIAAAIVDARKKSKIETTATLRSIVGSVFKNQVIRKNYSNIDVATKTFQAIRIFVNDELTEIDTAIKNLPKILNDGARIAMISFHALEDRIVKCWSKLNRDHFTPINKKVIKPHINEIKKNPRSRSAILRGFVYNEHGKDVEDVFGKLG
ncbi:MAG: 16S rRNA (cytosine(1402)-N(4))-methyltransferase RsmH [Holosporales bacterium]|jgi:16S rRNA (cytosine1402-N4)-methyltransferase|nr:16S rRNA (cytosine(1402)-N(4))-methyltransferase RsmH [Holosporales bacterium]